MRRRGWLALVGVLAVGAISVGGFGLWRVGSLPFQPGVLVTVRNVDASAPLRALTVIVTGAEYPVGDLGPGEAKTVRVNPRGESSAVLRYDRQGTVSEMAVDCYMESNYVGTLGADVTPDKLVRVKNEITI